MVRELRAAEAGGSFLGALILAMLVLFVVMAAIPPLGIGLAIFLIATRSRRHPAWLLAAGAGVAAAIATVVLFWHPYYINLTYYAQLPTRNSNGPAEVYADELRKVGFTNVAVDFDRSSGTHCPKMSNTDTNVDAFRDPEHNNMVHINSRVIIRIKCW